MPPQQFKKYENFANVSQWVIWFAAVGGAVLSLTGRPIPGGRRIMFAIQDLQSEIVENDL